MFNRKGTRDVLIVSMTATAVVVGMLTSQYTGYQLGFSTARNLVENSAFGTLLRGPDDIRTLIGTVTAVGSDRITLHTVSNNPFDDFTLGDRTVLVDSSTKIVTQPSPGVFKNDIANIQVGDTFLVTADMNIKSLKIFTAELIYEQVLNEGPVTTVTVDGE